MSDVYIAILNDKDTPIIRKVIGVSPTLSGARKLCAQDALVRYGNRHDVSCWNHNEEQGEWWYGCQLGVDYYIEKSGVEGSPKRTEYRLEFRLAGNDGTEATIRLSEYYNDIELAHTEARQRVTAIMAALYPSERTQIRRWGDYVTGAIPMGDNAYLTNRVVCQIYLLD